MNQALHAETGRIKGVIGDHVRSLGWLTLMIGLFVATHLITQRLISHLVFGNATKVMPELADISVIVVSVSMVVQLGFLLVAAPSQSVLAVIARLLANSYGRPWQALSFITVPVVAVLTWYCFDYLTPSDMSLLPPADYVPYQHGLTLSRYAKITAFQAAVTLLTIAYTATGGTRLRQWLAIACCGLACAAGVGLAAMREYPRMVDEAAARRTVDHDVERTTVSIAGAIGIRSVDWTRDGKAILARMLSPDEVVMITHDGQTTMDVPPMWSLNAVNTVGTRVFTTTSSPDGSYLESLDLMTMHAERKLIDRAPLGDFSLRPETHIGPSRSMKAIPFMSPLPMVADRPHVLDFYDGSTLDKVARFEFATGRPFPGLVSSSADGRTVAYSLNNDAQRIDVRSLPDGADIGHLDGNFASVVALSPDGRNIAVVEQRPQRDSGDGPTCWVSVYDVAAATLIGTREIPSLSNPENDRSCELRSPPIWSPDGGFVAYLDGQVGHDVLRLWHPFDRTAFDRSMRVRSPYTLIAIAPDASAIAIGDADDRVTILKTRNGKTL